MSRKLIRKLAKLSRMSPRECFVRSAQAATILSERLVGISAGEMSDAAFRRIIDPHRKCSSALSAATRVLDQIRSATEPAIFESGFRHDVVVPPSGGSSYLASARTRPQLYELAPEDLTTNESPGLPGFFSSLKRCS